MQSIATLLIFTLMFNANVFAGLITDSIDGDAAGPSIEAPSASAAPAAAPAAVPAASPAPAATPAASPATPPAANAGGSPKPEAPKKEDNGLRCNGKKAAISVGASMMLAIPAIAVMSIKAPPGKAQTDGTDTKVNQYQSYKNASGENESSRNWLTGSAAILGVLATVDGVFAASSIASGNYGESVKCIASAAILGALAAGQVIQIGQAEDARKVNLDEANKLVSSCKTTLSICGTMANKAITVPANCKDKPSDECANLAMKKVQLDKTSTKYSCDDSVALMECAEVVKAAEPNSAAGKITDQQMAAAINKGLNSAFGGTVVTSGGSVYSSTDVDNMCKAANMTTDNPLCKQWHSDYEGKAKTNVKLAGLANQLEKNGSIKIPSEIISALKNPTDANVKSAMKTLADSSMGANLFSASEKEQLKTGNLKALTGLGGANSEANTIAGGQKKKSSEGFDPFASSGNSAAGGSNSGEETNFAGEAFSSRMMTSGDINSNTNDSLFKMISTKYGEKFRILKDGF